MSLTKLTIERLINPHQVFTTVLNIFRSAICAYDVFFIFICYLSRKIHNKLINVNNWKYFIVIFDVIAKARQHKVNFKNVNWSISLQFGASNATAVQKWEKNETKMCRIISNLILPSSWNLHNLTDIVLASVCPFVEIAQLEIAEECSSWWMTQSSTAHIYLCHIYTLHY